MKDVVIVAGADASIVPLTFAGLRDTAAREWTRRRPFTAP